MLSNDRNKSPLLNIQSEPDYSSNDESDSNNTSDNSEINNINTPETDSNDNTVNNNHNTFFSNIFNNDRNSKKINMNNPKDSDLLLLKSIRQNDNNNTNINDNDFNILNKNNKKIPKKQPKNNNYLRVIESEPSSTETNDESSDNEESEDNESMRLFKENVHLLEEQPLATAYISEHEEENDEESENEDYNNNTRFNTKNIDKKQLTLWRFSNIDNLDSFFITFYKYYLKKGLYSYLIEKITNILILLFVLYISITLKFCINYSLFSNATRLEDIWVDKCFKTQLPFLLKVIIWVVYCFVFLKGKAIYKEFKSLQLMQNFYYYLLEIDDDELQIISWVEVLNRLIKFKDSNNLFQNSQSITFENIVNRIMRLDNYLIAIYSNESLMKFKVFDNRYRVSLTKSLEWNINLILINFFFANGQFAINSKNAKNLLELDLINKFRVAGFINIILTPFLVIYFTLLYVLKYFYNIKSIFNLREYNLENKYKLREYNELEHFFNKRLNLSIDIANEYLLQFPNNINNIIYKFLAFISGSLLAILTITTLLFDSENFLSFEITHNKSILFYISVIGAINTFTYNNIQQDKYKTYQPRKYFKELSKYTHFIPKNKNKGLTEKPMSNIETRDEFMKIYSLKLINIINEFGSLLLTPYILWFVLPKRCKNIIAFMQEITEKDHELGYICKYANYKPSEEEIRKSFFFMEDEEDADNNDSTTPVDVEELKFDKKRRIKDRLLRAKKTTIDDKKTFASNIYNNGDDENTKKQKRRLQNHQYKLNFKPQNDDNDKMMRSFMQFKNVYHENIT